MTEPSEPPDGCEDSAHPIPPAELGQYSPNRDPHAEADVADYVRGQAPDEVVQHVERIRTEVVLGVAYDVFDVTTDVGRWWVITNLTNLYSQQHFPSLDYTLSFHIGLMARMRSRPQDLDDDDLGPFVEVLRRLDQATARFEAAFEVEELQAVGMQLRECLLSLAIALRRRVGGESEDGHPKDADFVAWSETLYGHMCPGASNRRLRSHLKKTAQSAWRLVNWLTHARDASRSATMVALEACQNVIGNSVVITERSRTDHQDQCPQCSSRRVRAHFDIGIGLDGDYYLSCASCAWTSHPGEA